MKAVLLMVGEVWHKQRMRFVCVAVVALYLNWCNRLHQLYRRREEHGDQLVGFDVADGALLEADVTAVIAITADVAPHVLSKCNALLVLLFDVRMCVFKLSSHWLRVPS